jgi:SAM-dependent methyltransferase
VIEQLPRVIEAQEKSGIGGPDHPIRAVTRAIAFDGQAWTKERAAKVTQVFDELAPTWQERDRPGRLDPLRDALDRGDLPAGGLCVELGSGTGFATPLLAERFARVLAVDLSMEMLRRADPEAGHRLRGDGAHLPIRDASADVVVLMNAFLFPQEVKRVLAPAGSLVWVCSSGDETPIYLSAEDVDLALGEGFRGLASEAGGGTWSVHRRG